MPLLSKRHPAKTHLTASRKRLPIPGGVAVLVWAVNRFYGIPYSHGIFNEKEYDQFIIPHGFQFLKIQAHFYVSAQLREQQPALGQDRQTGPHYLWLP